MTPKMELALRRIAQYSRPDSGWIVEDAYTTTGRTERRVSTHHPLSVNINTARALARKGLIELEDDSTITAILDDGVRWLLSNTLAFQTRDGSVSPLTDVGRKDGSYV